MSPLNNTFKFIPLDKNSKLSSSSDTFKLSSSGMTSKLSLLDETSKLSYLFHFLLKDPIHGISYDPTRGLTVSKVKLGN